VKADGTGARRLDTGPGEAWGGSFSPDGQRVSYYHVLADHSSEIDVMRLDGSDRRAALRTKGAYGPTSWSSRGRIAFTMYDTLAFTPSIWAVNADGSALARLSADGTIADDAKWSPDGGLLAYTPTLNRNTNAEAFPIAVANADGSGSRLLTAGTGGKDFHPAWSPDGRWILYARLTGFGDSETVNCSLFKVPVGGGASVALTTGLERGACWGASWR
jgi:TolB protein